MSYANLAEMFFRRAGELATRPRYRYRVADGWREVTWQTMAERVRAIAAGLIDSGVAPGDRVALLSNTRPEWMEIDFAILACGALTVPIYESTLPAECGYIIASCGSAVVFVENPKQRAKIEEVTQRGFELDGVRQTIGVRAVVTIEGDPGAGQSLAALMERGRVAFGRTLAEIEGRVAALRRDQLATIVYTSGTTGPPKGVLQTHGNHLATIESLLKVGIAREGDVDFFFLPPAHSFARLIEYYGIAAGTFTALARPIDTLAEDLATPRPHPATAPSLTVNRPDRFKLGTVGLPLDCCELRLAPDGEILARGANIALGYHRRPEATAESWDSEGWFHTGDIGEFDADGFLRITDRKKDLIKTSGGKYVAPQKIENLLKLQPHVSQAVVIGDNRKYCTALVTLDQEEVARWASVQGLRFASPEEMAAHPRVRELIEGEVAAANRELASYESIKYFRILPRDLSTETGELTASLKVKRKVMAEHYRQQIEEMYAG